tara:strand:+ start:1432 stop:1770 length:339 start_codon:yes stop_codon:yes gene_type:complete
MAYLYIAENEGADAASDAGIFTSETFLSTNVAGAAQTVVHFKSIVGDFDGGVCVFNHVEGKHKEFAQCLADALNYSGPDMYVFFDEDNQVFDKQLIELGVVVPGTSTVVITN